MTRRLSAAMALLTIVTLSAAAQDWNRGVSLYNQKQYRQAIKEFHAVLRANPEYWQAWYYVGAGHFQLQEYEDTLDAFNNYLQNGQKDEKAQMSGSYYVGLSHYQLKKYDQAIPALAKYLSLAEKLKQPTEPAARAALGRAYVFTEKYAEAVPVLTASAAEMKDNPTTYYYLAYAQVKLGRRDQAIAALNQGLAVDPKDADMLGLLGDLHLQQAGQNPAAVKQAIAVGERLLAVQDGERAWSMLGRAYLIDKQYAKAAPLFDKYARAHQDSAAAWYNLGLARSRSDQLKPAAEALERAVKLAPTETSALLELAYVYERDKQYDKARSAYERAYEASGRKDEIARAGIERLKQVKP